MTRIQNRDAANHITFSILCFFDKSACICVIMGVLLQGDGALINGLICTLCGVFFAGFIYSNKDGVVVRVSSSCPGGVGVVS